ncbi:MAG: adenosylmethionine--8-amino-7-oxononanoate transaminase [Desulfobacteraceae bacterium]|nr:adenosylmethionine--8-amino-7-oxononanoate transaminase [Desulfobacteraceae bacterium]
MKNNNSNFWLPFTQMKEVGEIIEIVKGEGAYLYTKDKRKILDAISSWWVTIHGHGNQVVADAIARQAKTLEQVICAGFTHSNAEILSRRLVELLPPEITKMFYSDNGSTAVEVGLKMVFQYWKNIGDNNRKKFISFENAYHGDTLGAMSVGGRSVFTDQFKELMFDTVYLEYPSTFEGDDKAETKENAVIEKLEQILIDDGSSIAGLIIEPLIQGAGGMNMTRPVFLQKIEAIMKSHKIPVIYDEVMTGFGRTGDLFACLKANTNPDVICVSKGITGGFMPLAGTFCTDEIFESFYSDDPLKTFFHGHSYTANPIGCAAGVASLELLLEKRQFEKIEDWHKEQINKFKNNNNIEKIRVCGTIMALDIKTSNGGYLDKVGKYLKKEFLNKGFLLRPLGNVLYFLPPYCIEKEEIEVLYDCVNEVTSSL